MVKPSLSAVGHGQWLIMYSLSVRVSVYLYLINFCKQYISKK